MSSVQNSEKGKYAAPDGSRTWEYLAIITCAIFSFNIGTIIGWVSPTIVKLLEPGSPVVFTPGDISTMVAAGAVGHICAPPVSNLLVDRIGRRSTLLLSGLPVLISSAMIMVATHVWVIHIARVLAGFSLGMCICVSPMYLGEVSSTETRGLASSAIGVMVNFGILFAYGICPYLSIVKVAGVLMTVTLLFELTFWFMPESPYYFAMKGKFEEAETALERLRGKTNVTEELETIKDTMPKSADPERRVKSGTLTDLFTGRANRRAAAIAFLFLIPQHFGGYFAILMYGELVFKDAGMAIPSHLAGIAVGATQLISALLGSLIIDKVGRRPLILGAGTIAGLANVVIGGYLFAKEYTSLDVSDYSLVLLIAVLLEVCSISFGLLGTHMVLISEIFAPEVKGIGMCFVGISSGIFSVVASKMYIAIAITWGVGHALPFLGSAILVWATTILLLIITPETKGKTFLQIQQQLNR